jgi:WD40 repeat protein
MVIGLRLGAFHGILRETQTGALLSQVQGTDHPVGFGYGIQMQSDLQQLAAHRAPVSRVAFAPVGMRLATGCQSGELFLRDVGAADSPIAAAQMDAGIEIIAWSGREGHGLAVADTSGAIRLWSV